MHEKQVSSQARINSLEHYLEQATNNIEDLKETCRKQ